jgi:GNAT superfamily N-acetyltransferase
VDIHAVRAAYDAQIRRNTQAGEPGAVAEADAGVLRWLAPGTRTSSITWSELTNDSADAVIAAQVRYFAARGTPVEWKLYDYDQPADLARRLLAAGFVADDEELMLVAETAAIDSEVRLPDGVRLDLVTDQAGVAAMMAVRDLAFTAHPSPELGERLATQLIQAPELVQMVVATAGDEPVSAARVEFIPGTDFAGLWGGGTVPAWRGRGIFRALVAYRAGLAAARGYRYLQVDALPASRPILQRLGFEAVAATTPYVWTPSPSLASPGTLPPGTTSRSGGSRPRGRPTARSRAPGWPGRRRRSSGPPRRAAWAGTRSGGRGARPPGGTGRPDP